MAYVTNGVCVPWQLGW